MYKNRLLNLILHIVIILLSCITAIYLRLHQDSVQFGYENIFILPLVYVFTYIFFIRPVLNKYGLSIFMSVFIVVSFFRYIALSILVVESNWYYGRSLTNPLPENFEQAIYLMSYEILVYGIFIKFFHNRLIKEDSVGKDIALPNRTFIYVVFLFSVICLMAIRPSSLNFFSAFTINDSLIHLADASTFTSLIAVLVSVAKYIAMFLIITYSIKLFGRNSLITIVIVVITIALNIFIYFGTNRSDFIFNAIGSMILLVYLYRKTGIIISLVATALSPIIISSISRYRQTVTITGGENILIDWTDNLQVYLAGIYNVAMGLEINYLSQNISSLNAFFDILRSAIGPNIILQNFDIVSTAILFNERIYNSSHVAQIIPMISQSNFYFGFIMSPILGLIFIYIAVYFTKMIIKSKRIELIFFFSLFSGRLGFVMAQNGNILINDLTFFLPIFLIVYYLNNKVRLN